MTALHTPFLDAEDQISGFRPGMDYRKSDAWSKLSPAQSGPLVELAKKWIIGAPYAGQGVAIDTSCIEPFYKGVLEAAKIKVNSTHPHAYSSAYKTLRALSDAIKENIIEAPRDSYLHAAMGEINRSEAKFAQEIRNAALQTAREEIDRAQGLQR